LGILAQRMGDTGHEEAILHIDDQQRGAGGIEILEAMLLAAQLNHSVDHELRDRDLVHFVLACLRLALATYSAPSKGRLSP